MKRSCCIQCGAPFDMTTAKEIPPNGFITASTTNLKAFWYWYCPKHRLLDVPVPIFVSQERNNG
jgi:hypothetical protein